MGAVVLDQALDQRSDGLTNKLAEVYIHRDIKHTKRIMGIEDGLNNYKEGGYRRVNQTISLHREDVDWNHTQCLDRNTLRLRSDKC